MKYSVYNGKNQYDATVTKDNNKLDIKVGNPENKKHIPGVIFEYGVKSVNGKYGDVVINYEDVGALPDTTIIAQYVDENDVSHIINSWNITNIDNNPYLSLTCDDTNVLLATDEALANAILNALSLVGNSYVSFKERQSLTDAEKELAQENIGVDIASVTNYENLNHKPQINGVELIGNLTSEDLGIINYDTGNGLEVNDNVLSAKLGNGLKFDLDGAIQIEDEVIFNCGTSTTVI